MVPGRFDTALVTLPFSDGQPGDFRSSAVARIRCIVSFTPSQLSHGLVKISLNLDTLHTLTGLRNSLPSLTQIMDFKKCYYFYDTKNSSPVSASSMVPVENIWQSVHLLPAFGQTANRDWKSSNVLDMPTHFYVNSLSGRFAYSTVR
jgi:hypothetical protein